MSEIWEEYVDCNEIYNIFIEFILEIYWEKINLSFYSWKSAMKQINNINYEKILSEINDAKKIVDKCVLIMNKHSNLQGNNIIYFNLKDLENFKLKLKVKEEIIKIKNASFLKKILNDNEKYLMNLYNQYYLWESYDKDDLKELKVLAGKKEEKLSDDKISEKFEEEFQNSILFNEWITKKMTNLNYGEISNIITRILTEYPYSTKKDEDRMWDDFYFYKSKQMKLSRFILMIKGQYNRLLNDDKINDIKKQVYENILLFLNCIDGPNIWIELLKLIKLLIIQSK